ncbi:MAG: TraB/GumN family protein, partial [Proteobacteria bacterium]|nr:TraB/GumN family protein [Pseudomonadota bacterium]
MIIARLLPLLILLATTTRSDDTAHPVTLWEIQGAHNTVYLLGSIHMLRAEDYPLPTVIESTYAKVEILIMEIDMDDLDPVASQIAFVDAGVLQDGTTLRDLMGDALYDQALNAAAAVDIPLDMLDKTEPWYAAMMIEVMLLSRIGFDPGRGVEMYLLKKAIADGKPIEGLETLAQQIGFLDGLSIAAQRDMLLTALVDGAKIEDLMDEIILAWRHGDIDSLESSLLESFAEHKELNKVLVSDRNRRWAKHINTLLTA